MQTQEALNILGLTQGASEKEINSAFRKLAGKHHPDKENGNETQFKKINEAYQFLKQYGTDYQPNFNTGNPFDSVWSDDFINDFFRKVAAEKERRQARTHYTYSGFSNPFYTDPFKSNNQEKFSQDVVISQELSFEEAVLGTKKSVKFSRKSICESCSGLGYNITGSDPCNKCDGKGSRTYPGVNGKKPCTTCGATGKINNTVSCASCNGFCSVSVEKSLDVKIPPGAFDGRQIRVQKQGNYGKVNSMGRKDYGDLILNIKVKKDPELSLDQMKSNILSTVNLSLYEALSGVTKEIRTVHGNKRVKFPAGLKEGAQVRLPGLGIPGLINSDHLIEVNVEYPKGKKLNKILEILQEEDIEVKDEDNKGKK